MSKTIAMIIGLCTLIGIVFGVFFYIDSRYALAQNVAQLEKRLDYKILSDQYMAVQNRIWTIEDRNAIKKPNATTKEELRKLESDKAELGEKIKVMEKK